ncbi:uncharacterized protein MELLADRAFT_110724 [Melampsora larici-populina 98AG31]|uniref:Uncharacterized protein n=1 Tax=Melampsora larici-populina (strain 98AG31 / pathotype 3-4-7) TaxID=747676 RepID=F4S0R4_MELLP|nr:uncharacterized protein MELLADRAFT_110724 [Melampsora larici-populina 98AG31]EGG01808.1 hypothetical protein MELLADRAFT_110724 [Melampsora larici-populina 98AG31]
MNLNFRALCTKPTSSSIKDSFWSGYDFTPETNYEDPELQHQIKNPPGNNIPYLQGQTSWSDHDGATIPDRSAQFDSYKNDFEDLVHGFGINNPAYKFEIENNKQSDIGTSRTHEVIVPLDNGSKSRYSHNPTPNFFYEPHSRNFEKFNEETALLHPQSLHFGQASQCELPMQEIGPHLDILNNIQNIDSLSSINDFIHKPDYLHYGLNQLPYSFQDQTVHHSHAKEDWSKDSLITQDKFQDSFSKNSSEDDLGKVEPPKYSSGHDHKITEVGISKTNTMCHLQNTSKFLSYPSHASNLLHEPFHTSPGFQTFTKENGLPLHEHLYFDTGSWVEIPLQEIPSPSNSLDRSKVLGPFQVKSFGVSMPILDQHLVDLDKNDKSCQTSLEFDEANPFRGTEEELQNMKSLLEPNQKNHQVQEERTRDEEPGINQPLHDKDPVYSVREESGRKAKVFNLSGTLPSLNPLQGIKIGKKSLLPEIELDHIQKTTSTHILPCSSNLAHSDEHSGAILPKKRKLHPLVKFKDLKTQNDHASTKTHLNYSPTENKFQASMEKQNIKSTKSSQVRQVLQTLKQIGSFNVDNSLTISYETSHWFLDLKTKMIGNSPGNQSWIRQVSLATKHAHSYITMTFLALLSIYDSVAKDQTSIDQVLRDGWEFLKSYFEKWENIKFEYRNIKGFKKTKKIYEAGDWHDHHFVFQHLAKLDSEKNMRSEILKSIVDEWRKYREGPEIPIQSPELLLQDILNSYQPGPAFILGGFFSRGDVKNPQFEHINSHLSLKSYSKEKARAMGCVRIANSANFMSQEGFPLCQEVHKFFLSLMQSLLDNYRSMNGCDVPIEELTLWDQSPIQSNVEGRHKSNMKKIVKAVSIAEYKVTVGFIGIVRELYQRDLAEDDLRLLISNAWEFLKITFSEWEEFKFEDEHLQMYFTPLEKRPYSDLYWSDAKRIFHGLWQIPLYETCPIPITLLRTLFKSWSKAVWETNFNTGVIPGFKTKNLSHNYFVARINNLDLRAKHRLWELPKAVGVTHCHYIIRVATLMYLPCIEGLGNWCPPELMTPP